MGTLLLGRVANDQTSIKNAGFGDERFARTGNLTKEQLCGCLAHFKSWLLYAR